MSRPRDGTVTTSSERSATMITRPRDLHRLCAHIRETRRFGLDTEFVMEDVYEPELCLVQVAATDGVFLIDSQETPDLTPLWELVSDPQIETVLHAGQEDLALCVHAVNQPPRNIFDVQIAAGLVTSNYPMSLSKLVQQKLHIKLHKSQTLTDWRKRPLSEDQLLYANEDVAYLLPLHDKLTARLKKLGRMEWAREEFAAFERIELYQRPPEAQLARVKGTGSLHGSALVAALDLMQWREQLADRLNRPARAVLKDHLLVEIAKHGWSKPEQVRSLRGLNLRKDHINDLCAVLVRSAEKPPAPKSAHRTVRAEHPLDAVLMPLLTSVLRSEAARLDIAYGLLATKQGIADLVEPFVDGRLDSLAPVPDLLSGWRGEVVGRTLRKVLTGSWTVQVDPAGNGSPLRFCKPSDRPARKASSAEPVSAPGVEGDAAEVAGASTADAP